MTARHCPRINVKGLVSMLLLLQLSLAVPSIICIALIWEGADL